jgi:hypothetical protein
VPITARYLFLGEWVITGGEMKAKLGVEAGITATAHKLARIFYAVVKNQREYDQTIWGQQDQERRRRIEAEIRKQARRLGLQLVPIQPSQEPVEQVPYIIRSKVKLCLLVRC